MPAVRLQAFSVSALDAEDRSAAALSAVLGVAEPAAWPPLYDDAGVRGWFRKQLLTKPDMAQWFGYYVVAEIDGADTVVGTAGYKGPPDGDGKVEIGYSIVSAYHRRGIGTGAVGQLLERAFAAPGVHSVTAETPFEAIPSRRLLERCGFTLTGGRSDPEEGELALYSVER